MNIIGIIPARFASTRFPAKALADIAGKSMVQRVYEQATKCTYLSEILVATDHRQIFDHVQQFGGNAVMTSEQHQSGTDRCYEAYSKHDSGHDFIINIQGDEPFIHPDQIGLLCQLLTATTELATLVKMVEEPDILMDPNTPKVIVSAKSKAIYFSRHPIPFVRGHEVSEWLSLHTFYKHIGIYAYRADILKNITTIPVSKLEKAEALEQLRWLDHGYSIDVGITQHDSHGIDTRDDLAKAIHRFM